MFSLKCCAVRYFIHSHYLVFLIRMYQLVFSQITRIDELGGAHGTKIWPFPSVYSHVQRQICLMLASIWANGTCVIAFV